MKDRIQLLVKALNYTAAQFADEVGVQKSGISHIISGRNNPSLDFIQKILLRFPEVNMDWLMFGKGPVFKDRDFSTERTENKAFETRNIQNSSSEDLFSGMNMNTESEFSNLEDQKEEVKEINARIEKSPAFQNENNSYGKINKGSFFESTDKAQQFNDRNEIKRDFNLPDLKSVEKIVVFYTDNTFKEYKPE